METGLLAIGEVARLSGLTVSALRFYDGAGVFAPAVVDGRSGYRWYRRGQVDEARLIAALRRVGLPLPEIGRVLAFRAQCRPAEALAILDAHLKRLEAGLSDARRELCTARAHLLQTETTMTEPAMTDPTNPALLTWITLSGSELAAELAAVRFAMAPAGAVVLDQILADEILADENLAVLRGVLFDLDSDDGVLRLVATDRYRMAASLLAATSSHGPSVQGPSVQVSASARFVDEAIERLRDHPGPVRLGVAADRLVVDTGTVTFGDRALPGIFPDYRRLLPLPQAEPVIIDGVALRAEIGAARTRTMVREDDGEPYELMALAFEPDDAGVLRVVVVDPEAVPDDGDADLRRTGGRTGGRVGVNREFLLQALNARAGGQLVLELDGPIAPLAIRDPARDGVVSLLMPCRLP